MAEETNREPAAAAPAVDRRSELEAELAALNAESEAEIAEVIEEAAETVSETVAEAAEEVAEVIEQQTGETLSPDEVRILRGIIAAQASADAAPEVQLIDPPAATEVAEAVVEEPPDVAPVDTHWSQRRILSRS